MVYLYLSTALWHALAVYFFVFRPRHMLRSFTRERPVSLVASDLMRFLGYLNLGYVLLAGWGAYRPPAQAAISLVLALANGSQFVMDLQAHWVGQWKRKLLGISLLDGFFMIAHLVGFLCL